MSLTYGHQLVLLLSLIWRWLGRNNISSGPKNLHLCFGQTRSTVYKSFGLHPGSRPLQAGRGATGRSGHGWPFSMTKIGAEAMHLTSYLTALPFFLHFQCSGGHSTLVSACRVFCMIVALSACFSFTAVVSIPALFASLDSSLIWVLGKASTATSPLDWHLLVGIIARNECQVRF